MSDFYSGYKKKEYKKMLLDRDDKIEFLEREIDNLKSKIEQDDEHQELILRYLTLKQDYESLKTANEILNRKIL